MAAPRNGKQTAASKSPGPPSNPKTEGPDTGRTVTFLPGEQSRRRGQAGVTGWGSHPTAEITAVTMEGRYRGL